MENVTISVEGMSCEHCKQAVEENVSALNGVDKVTVDLDTGNVTVVYNTGNVTMDTIQKTIEEQGYDVA